MAFLDKLVLVVCISSIAIARTIRSPQEAQPQHTPNYFPQDDSYDASDEQELPRIGNPSIPFTIPEPSTELRPPQIHQNAPVTFLEIPVPSPNLRAPTEMLWNPENDPIYYYELPPSLTKLDSPTNKFPKKYNKDVHSKEKAFSSQPKIEIELIPIEEKELIAKQNSLEKKYNSLAKLQNKKELENLKAQ